MAYPSPSRVQLADAFPFFSDSDGSLASSGRDSNDTLSHATEDELLAQLPRALHVADAEELMARLSLAQFPLNDLQSYLATFRITVPLDATPDDVPDDVPDDAPGNVLPFRRNAGT